ncbi:MAG TPA: hypothetical protein DCE41_36980 [Cytophagales bacterium]|nr:hypothetical protein [Cytophagales bacterium]HAA21166.1 hypothetical protein [Cytophagales bacterium]HAP60686.1 hypothetical protein [Cytophagales bacterium]
MQATAQQPSEFMLGGIQVNEPDHQAWVQGLDAAGMNTVAVTAYAKQGDWNTDHIWWEEEEPSVLAEIEAAKAQGLKVVFIARVALDHSFPANAHFWHGMIMPATDIQLASWFRQYTQFVVEWAQKCEALGVEVLGIGSEMRVLSATVPTQEIPQLEGFFLNPISRYGYRALRWRHREEIQESQWWKNQGHADYRGFLKEEVGAQTAWAKQVTYWGRLHRKDLLNERRRLIERHWRNLIEEVRQVYTGQLTYAANFDNFHRVGFWDALDVVGINAYFPLTEATEVPQMEEVVQAWIYHGNRVSETLKELGVPKHKVLFTELGYTRQAGTLVAPWSGFGYVFMPKGKLRYSFHLWEAMPSRLQDRASALEGLVQARALGNWPGLIGVLYWKLTTLPSMGIIEPFALVLGDGDPLEPALQSLKVEDTKPDGFQVEKK